MTGMLEVKVALITGGGRGIGRQTALLFAREGARVVVADLSADGAEETVGLIEKAGGQTAAVIADVAKPDDVTATGRQNRRTIWPARLRVQQCRSQRRDGGPSW